MLGTLPASFALGLVGLVALAFLVFNPFSGSDKVYDRPPDEWLECHADAEVAIDDLGRVARVLSSNRFAPIKAGEFILGPDGQPIAGWLTQGRKVRDEIPGETLTAVYRGKDGLVHQGALECIEN